MKNTKNRSNEELAVAYKQTGDNAYAQALLDQLEYYLRWFVFKISNSNDINCQDLLQQARLTVLLTAQRFDETKGTKFTTYLYPWLLRDVGVCGNKAKGIPRYLKDQAANHHGSLSEIAAAIGISTDRLCKNIELYDAITQMVSLNVVDTSVGSGDSIEDSIQEEQSLTASKLSESEDNICLRMDLHNMLESLSIKEKDIISRHYLEGEPFVKIAESYQQSKSMICWLHLRAINKLKTILESYDAN